LRTVIWLSTVFIQIPTHRRLTYGFDIEAHRKPVMTNRTRTLARTGRSVRLIAVAAWEPSEEHS
jgi:hypothetical protein